MNNRIDYLEENKRVYTDVRDIQALLGSIKMNPVIKTDSKTIDLIIAIFESFNETVEEGACESDITLSIDDNDILDIQKELNKEMSKTEKILAKADRKKKSKKLKKEVEQQLAEDIEEPEAEEK